jgi:hypothetical protein
LRHRLLQVGTVVAVGGDAIGHDEAVFSSLAATKQPLDASPRGPTWLWVPWVIPRKCRTGVRQVGEPIQGFILVVAGVEQFNGTDG